MKKEDLIKGKKYKYKREVFMFEKFNNNGEPCFLDENQRGFFFSLTYALNNLTPIEEPEKDLNLSVDDSVYLGKVECKCIESSNYLDFPYTVSLSDGNSICIMKDGRIAKNVPPIFSLEPYDLPEMVYEKPIEVGEMVFAWSDKYAIEHKCLAYGEYKGKVDLMHAVGRGIHKYISKTNPFDEKN